MAVAGSTAVVRNRVGAAPVGWRAHSTLLFLCLIGIVNYIDRQVLSILLEHVKHDLHASDTQMGLLNGLAFSLAYLVAGIPLARLVDRGNRRNILSACLVAWSIATAACGLAQSYANLALARMGVAAGESGASPSSQSIIADIYPREKRATALGLWSASTAIGIGSGVLAGGWLGSALPWQQVFMVVAIPGLILAVLMMLTVPEPARTDRIALQPSFAGSVRYLFSIRSYVLALTATAFFSITGSAVLAWVPTYLIRVQHMSGHQVGTSMGLTLVVAFLLSNLLSGWFADRFGGRNPAAYFKQNALATMFAIPLGGLLAFASSGGTAIAALFAFELVLSIGLVPMYVIVLSLAPSNMRGVAGFNLTIAINLVGLGLGPLLIGALNDALAPSLGVDAIRYSLIASTGALAVASGFSWWGSRVVNRDFATYALDQTPGH